MHPAIFNNLADIFFCINMSFVVVSTLEINKQKQTDGWMNNNIIKLKPGEWMDAVCHAQDCYLCHLSLPATKVKLINLVVSKLSQA